MNQPVALGGIFWLFISSIILYYIFGASQVPNTIKQNINKAVKAVIGILFFLLPVPIFARIFELWANTSGDIQQSLDLLRTVSNMAVSIAIGGTTTYIAYRQYQVNRASLQIARNKENIELYKRMGLPPYVHWK